MKGYRLRIVLVSTLILTMGQLWAQPIQLKDSTVVDRTGVTDPADAVSDSTGDWLAFSIPAVEGTRSPCCWKGSWNQFGESACELESQNGSYGTTSETPFADSVIVYARIKKDGIDTLRVVGEHCPVSGNDAVVNWLGHIDESAGLDWLEDSARHAKDDSVAHSALYAMALHRSGDVTTRLTAMAKDSDNSLTEQAIFWLGESRGRTGLQALIGLLEELPTGQTRQHLNFAISLAGTPEAKDSLVEISRNDPDQEQRSSALFWLTQEFPQDAQSILRQTLKTEHDPKALEQAIFAISQLPEEQAGAMLLEIARDPATSRDLRRQALFWLAQSSDDETLAALTDLLTR